MANEDFIAMPIEQFMQSNIAYCDIYLKLTDKYLLLFRKDDLYPSERLTKYKNKGAVSLYVKNQDRNVFMDTFIRTSNAVQGIQSAAFSEKIRSSSKKLHDIYDITKNYGITDTVIYETNEIISSNIFVLEKTDKAIYDILNEILNTSNRFFEKCLLTSYLAIGIAYKMDWKSPATIQKLGFAAILQDIGLSKQSITKVENGGMESLSKEETKDYIEHPLSGANIVSPSQTLPPNIADLILYHHEKPDGTGFPRAINWKHTSQINAVLNISVEMAHQIQNCWPRMDKLITVIKMMKSKYNYGPYKAPLIGLLELLKGLKINNIELLNF